VAETAASMGRMLGMALTPVSPVMVERSLSVRFETLSVPLEEMKVAARLAGGRLNDAFVAATIGGFRRYHDVHGAPVTELRMTMPINVRGEDKADLAGNAFAPARFLVPLDIDDPVERMRVIHDLVRRQRAEPAMALLDPMALVVHRLPASVSTALFQSMVKGQDFVTSNVPGVPVPVFIAGSAILAQYPFGPLSWAAANLTLLSYQDQVHVGINTDVAAIPDPDRFLACMSDGFDEIRKLA
jgi:diacylglycerol O-acyltransferase